VLNVVVLPVPTHRFINGRYVAVYQRPYKSSWDGGPFVWVPLSSETGAAKDFTFNRLLTAFIQRHRMLYMPFFARTPNSAGTWVGFTCRHPVNYLILLPADPDLV
jgi:hypothetical protein